jgi:hypothetical protein
MLAVIRWKIFFLTICNPKRKISRTIILPFVVYGCETWSPTLREVRRLRVFKNRGAEENVWASEGRGFKGV